MTTEPPRAEVATATPTVDEHLAALTEVDARTRAGKAARHHAAMAELALERERRHNAQNVRALNEARDDAQTAAQAVVDAARAEADATIAEYRERITALSPDYTEGNPATIESPVVVDESGRRSSNRHRAFTLAEVEEALIRFRVAGAGDLAPIDLSGDRYGHAHSITCHVRDELMEAREQRDLRRAREEHARRARRIQYAVGAVVVPPAALLLLAGLKWTYMLLIGWVI